MRGNDKGAVSYVVWHSYWPTRACCWETTKGNTDLTLLPLLPTLYHNHHHHHHHHQLLHNRLDYMRQMLLLAAAVVVFAVFVVFVVVVVAVVEISKWLPNPGKQMVG